MKAHSHGLMDHAKNLTMNKNNLNAKVGKTLKADEKRRLYPAIFDKPISLIRKDIQDWRIARMAAMNADQPSRWRIYNLRSEERRVGKECRSRRWTDH